MTLRAGTLAGIVLPHVLIFVDYVRIPMALRARWRHPASRSGRRWFAAFILPCGVTHLLAAWVLSFYGCFACWYWIPFTLESLFLWYTALVSLFVAWRVEDLLAVADWLAQAAEAQAAFERRLSGD